MLEQEIINKIDAKSVDLNGKGDVAVKVAEIINKLNSYIEKKISLSIEQVDDYITCLGRYFTTSMYIPIVPRTKFLRARSFDSCHLEIDVRQLSYINDHESHHAKRGRLNPEGVPIYYGCIYFSDTGGVNVGFAEINAKQGKVVNILRSVNEHDLNVYYVGIYDLVHRNCKPQFMSDGIFAKFCEVYNYQEYKFSPSVFLAHQLCDAFFSDILRREEFGNLFKVTSRLPTIFMEEGKNIDGIIYTSVKAEGSPVVAIKPKSIKKKFKHIGSDSFDILYDYGYAKYNARKTDIGTIEKNRINWAKKT